MGYRTIGSDPATRREVSVLSLGAMLMGSRTDEATSFAILDRYAEAGGTLLARPGAPPECHDCDNVHQRTCGEITRRVPAGERCTTRHRYHSPVIVCCCSRYHGSSGPR
jgi:hypothetical protein